MRDCVGSAWNMGRIVAVELGVCFIVTLSAKEVTLTLLGWGQLA
jgi:hypothetical protein